MIVTRKNLPSVLKELRDYSQLARYFACDTETTGLWPHKGDRLFSIIMAFDRHAFYFNYLKYPDLHDDFILPRESIQELAPIFVDSSVTCYMHNAKFDLAMLACEGISVSNTVHDTEVMARIIYNAHFDYGLDDCAKRDLNIRKDPAVADYIKKHKLYTEISLPHKDKPIVLKHFDKVPFGLIAPYGEQDGMVTCQLGQWQKTQLKEMSASATQGVEPISTVVDNEIRLTPVLLKMEKSGILTDQTYCQQGFEYEVTEFQRAAREFHELTGFPLVNSPKGLKEPMLKMGVPCGKTAKGGDSFSKKSLEAVNHPVVDKLMEYRDHHKRATTYYQNFTFFADSQGVIHPNIRQSGTRTGRMSYSEPNLQNLTKEDEAKHEGKPFQIRKCFIPRKDHALVMIDYDQMEYKLFLDYAGQMDLIELVDKGHDLHQATGDLVGIERYPAKRINFGLLYGMGVDKLAGELKITYDAAYQLRAKYFAKLPQVALLIQKIMNTAKQRGWVHNWMGRKYYFPRGMGVHAAPNYIIQGGCADIMKLAMNRIDDYLLPYKTRMLEQVHDELLFEVPLNEFDIIPEIKKIMENAYAYKHLKLTCSVSHSFKSWGEKSEGMPGGEETRNEVQRDSACGSA